VGLALFECMLNVVLGVGALFIGLWFFQGKA